MTQIIIFYKNDRPVHHEYFFGSQHYRDFGIQVSSASALARHRLGDRERFDDIDRPNKAIVYTFADVKVEWLSQDPAWCFYVTCMGAINPYYADNDEIVRRGLAGILSRIAVTL